ncbi:hypothetical protein BX266_6674 [Streptomyces sp. TLI_171]|nr:hypothetical protein BX266_6674 [Streptomyces sp. TLI_171]
MQSGRIAEQTEAAPTELRPTGAGRAPHLPAEPSSADHYRTERERSEEYRLDQELEELAAQEPAVAADSVAVAADDPAWDYEDVILRSVN